jgi:pyruvate/2-oxoglutarate dehydrogenase complex dihydrolipoamide dehydrogenase (E3) component
MLGFGSMKYDLIISGDTHQAQHAALEAARNNRLVAVVRTSSFLESIFQFPLESWNWNDSPTWKSLKQQFRLREKQTDDLYARAGIDLIEGRSLEIHQQLMTLSTRSGELIELEADQFLETNESQILLPNWLQSEVPHVTPLTMVPRLEMLPESIMVEGNSLPALRFAVMCARLHRHVVISSTGWNLPEFEFELEELEDEANQRGILRLEQQQMLSVSENPSGEFDFWLVTGDIYRTGLYVFATETTTPQQNYSEPHSTFTPKLKILRDKFQASVF